ncbi:MAG: VPGUxxT family thioredoxin-like (seleno)protein, type 2 [Verrucomicrobiota bacterium]
MIKRFSLFLGSVAVTAIGWTWHALAEKTQPIEIGTVAWGRDLDAALTSSAESGKPVFLLFQEVPGCAGCQQFGREVLSDPETVNLIETHFEPIMVPNNQPGEAAAILRQFNEPAWNYQVVRFLNSEGVDLIPRKDRVWTKPHLTARMNEALEAAGRPSISDSESTAADLGEAAFAMFCFWTGEARLGAINGVLTTEAGWIGSREVTRVTFDRTKVSFAELVAKASALDCARSIYTTTDSDAEVASASRLSNGILTDAYRIARESDQKRQIQGTLFAKLTLTPEQATKVNAFARTDPQRALSFLTDSQRRELNL